MKKEKEIDLNEYHEPKTFSENGQTETITWTETKKNIVNKRFVTEEKIKELMVLLDELKKEEPKKKTWGDLGIDELCFNYSGYTCIDIPETLFKNFKKYIALQKLIDLRDDVNGYWKPNFFDDYTKSAITNHLNKLVLTRTLGSNHVMVFENDELAEQFLSDHKELLETAKELL